jgi:hypothetical protein
VISRLPVDARVTRESVEDNKYTISTFFPTLFSSRRVWFRLQQKVEKIQTVIEQTS